MAPFKSKAASALDFLIDEDSNSDNESEGSEASVEDEEESVLFQFYEEILDSLMTKFPVTPNRTQAAVQHIGHNYRNMFGGRTADELDYDDMNYCLAYLHRYAVCHAALVRHVMIEILYRSCPLQLTKALTKSELSVSCLGGGPGNDLVGFLSALHGEHTGLSHLDVTVVDKMAGWGNVFSETVQKLKEGKCGDASKLFRDLNVTHKFIRADLEKSKLWSDELKTKLGNADIVLLVKFLSNVPNSQKLLIVKDVVKRLKMGALLIYIDCPYPYRVFSNLSHCLYPVYHKFSMVSFKFNLAKSRFGQRNITACTAYVRVFEKRQNPP